MGVFHPDSDPGSVAETPAEECRPRPLWLRIVRGVAITVGLLVAIVAVAGLLLYNFGGPSGSAVPGVLERYDQLVASGQQPAIQKRFVIPIPGCQCHSKDPGLTAQHMRRRMTECMKCHSTNPAHTEPGVL